jgi:tRNA G18 (ribose-2'-O)-methylase SpoU
MPQINVSSLDDPRVEPYRNLKDTNRTRWGNILIVEGEKLTRRLIASRFPVESVLLGRRFVEQLGPLVPPDVPTFVVPDELVEPLVGYNFHRGILACGRRLPGPRLEELATVGNCAGEAASAIVTRSVTSTLALVVCPDVQDPVNLGSILRIANAFGAEGVLIGRGSADPFSRRVLRVSMGAALRVPIVETENMIAALDTLKAFDVQLLATVLAADAEPLNTFTCPPRFALLLGSEGHGLSPEIIARCDHRLTIPMRDGVDSLNVAVAAGIFLHRLLS